ESQRDVREVNGVAPSDIDRQCRKVLIILKRRRESSIPTNHGGALYFNSAGLSPLKSPWPFSVIPSSERSMVRAAEKSALQSALPCLHFTTNDQEPRT